MAVGQPQKPVNRGPINEVRSSLPYQILMYLNGWYFGLYFICEILMYIFKSETLPFATGVLASEIILVFVLAALEVIRLFFGRRGNLTETTTGVVFSIILSIPSACGCLFILLWQTYVLRAEVILTAIQLSFIGLELIFGIISMISFARGPPS